MANGEYSHDLAKPHYSLNYGMRLELGTAAEMTHPHVQITLPDGSEGSMALQSSTAQPMRLKLSYLRASMPFFDIYAEVDPDISYRR